MNSRSINIDEIDSKRPLSVYNMFFYDFNKQLFTPDCVDKVSKYFKSCYVQKYDVFS